jgi:hypothetical protein
LKPSIAALALATLLAPACTGTRHLADPVLEIRSGEARELGVSTDYGLIFLGRTVRAGRVEIVAWFGDGPSVEATAVEPLGGGLFTAETDIRLPRVPLSFETPEPGERLTVAGRSGSDRWESEVVVRRHASVDGILTNVPGELDRYDGQIGAPVFRTDARGKRRLVGLAAGRVELTDGDGARREFLAILGPDQLWRLVTYRRDWSHRRRWVYRDDVL